MKGQLFSRMMKPRPDDNSRAVLGCDPGHCGFDLDAFSLQTEFSFHSHLHSSASGAFQRFVLLHLYMFSAPLSHVDDVHAETRCS